MGIIIVLLIFIFFIRRINKVYNFIELISIKFHEYNMKLIHNSEHRVIENQKYYDNSIKPSFDKVFFSFKKIKLESYFTQEIIDKVFK